MVDDKWKPDKFYWYRFRYIKVIEGFLQILYVPCLIIFKNGNTICRIVGILLVLMA